MSLNKLRRINTALVSMIYGLLCSVSQLIGHSVTQLLYQHIKNYFYLKDFTSTNKFTVLLGRQKKILIKTK